MDQLYKGVAFGGAISVTVIEATQLVQEAMDIHNLSPLAAAALGRTLIASSFMCSCLKNEGDRLSVTISGDGVGGQIVVSGDSSLRMRGYIENGQCCLPLKQDGKLDVGGCVGKGRLTVVRSGDLKESYTGSCNLVSGEIAEDFAAYYAYSEQQPTAIALGVKIGKDGRCAGAGGVVFQPLPGADENVIDQAEKKILSFKDISSLIENMGAAEFVKNEFCDYQYEIRTPLYKCLCSKDYIDSMLITLGEKELRETIAELGKIEVHCHFCNKNYVYEKKDVDELLSAKE